MFADATVPDSSYDSLGMANDRIQLYRNIYILYLVDR